MKYRVVWKPETKVVLEVVEDSTNTITHYTDGNEHAVVGDVATIKGILQSQGYDVSVIDAFVL